MLALAFAIVGVACGWDAVCWSSFITKRFPAAVRSTMYIFVASAVSSRVDSIHAVIQLLLPSLLQFLAVRY